MYRGFRSRKLMLMKDGITATVQSLCLAYTRSTFVFEDREVWRWAKHAADKLLCFTEAFLFGVVCVFLFEVYLQPGLCSYVRQNKGYF